VRGEPGEVRPQTHALDALIREALAGLGRRSGAPRTDALLFLGNPHHAFPALVVQDPVLEPVDKLVWMVIYTHGRASAVSTPFPHYRDIARLANIASTSTIARAIAILRATRWLSLCARGRDAGGRFSGNVYALHDEPLPFADALHLDPGYVAFLHEAGTHNHARVRQVVSTIAGALNEALREGLQNLSSGERISRRLDARSGIERASDAGYFDLGAESVSALRRTPPNAVPGDHPPATNAHQHQNSKLVQHQNSKSVANQISNAVAVLSDSFLYRDVNHGYLSTDSTTTTTTPSNEGPPKFVASPSENAVDSTTPIFPRRLSEDQRAVAMRHLGTVPPALHQALLDELAGRLHAEQQGARPVHDVLRYFARMCIAAREGTFVPNLGLRIARERARERERERNERERAEHAVDPVDRAASERAERARAELKKLLGIPSPREPNSAG
jgi:hypothetical protein